MAQSLPYQLDEKGEITIIRITTPRFTAVEAPALKALFTELVQNEGKNFLVVDLSGVDYIDSSGLSALLLGHRLTRDSGGSLALFGAHGWTEKVIRISELHRVFNMFESEEEALDYLILTLMGKQLGDDE